MNFAKFTLKNQKCKNLTVWLNLLEFTGMKLMFLVWFGWWSPDDWFRWIHTKSLASTSAFIYVQCTCVIKIGAYIGSNQQNWIRPILWLNTFHWPSSNFLIKHHHRAAWHRDNFTFSANLKDNISWICEKDSFTLGIGIFELLPIAVYHNNENTIWWLQTWHWLNVRNIQSNTSAYQMSNGLMPQFIRSRN